MNGFNFNDVSRFYFTGETLARIQSHTIGIAGAGGIGSNCALLLVRSGFSRFVIADFDLVSLSNLNRQTYSYTHIGREKVNCLREVCRTINPDLQMTSHGVRITAENILPIFEGCNIIIEAFDNAESKALLFSSFLHSTEKMIIGVSGIAGIGSTGALTLKRIRNNCYVAGDGTSAVSDTTPPFAPRVVTAAAIMADAVLEFAINGTVKIA